jgi:AraC-like DNA-binding protein
MTTAGGFDHGRRAPRDLAAVSARGGTRLPLADAWITYQTRVLAEARDFLAATYGAHDVRWTADPATFEFSARRQHLGQFGIDILHGTGHVEMVRGDAGSVYAVEVLQGRLGIETDGGALSLGAGSTVLAPTDEPRRVTWDNVRLIAVGMETLAFRRIAAELAGVDPVDVQLQLSCATSPERSLQWSSAVRYVVQGVLSHPAVVGSPLARKETFRLLATVALEVFPQEGLSISEPPDAPAGPIPATVGRAVEFIEANAREDVTIEDIAHVARLSVRGTQAAFRRHLGTTPAAYLRRVRLAGAHRDLLAADPTQGSTVADIAGRWGFVHLGHFAASYRQYYGVPPNHTLVH